MDETAKIRELNDSFRKDEGCYPGRWIFTGGVRALGQQAAADIRFKVMYFNNFTPDNDPHEEHDFGSFTYDRQKIFWKIDYYSNAKMEWGSEAPHDPKKSYRVLTVMLAEEY